MILAFCYDTYYMWNVKQNFRGVFDDVDEALDSIVGGDHEHQNLELIDSETLEFHKFEWNNLYNIDYPKPDEMDYSEYYKLDETEQKAILTHKYDESIIETTIHELNKNNGKYYHLAQAGRWSQIY